MKAIEGYSEQANNATSASQGPQTAPRATTLLSIQGEHDCILKQSSALIAALVPGKNRSTSQENFTHEFAKLGRLLTAHVRNEERILLPIIAEYFDIEAVDAIRREHAEVLATLEKLSNQISRSQSVRGLVETATDFDSMVRAHFSREDNVIYWFAKVSLSKKGGFYNGQD